MIHAQQYSGECRKLPLLAGQQAKPPEACENALSDTSCRWFHQVIQQTAVPVEPLTYGK